MSKQALTDAYHEFAQTQTLVPADEVVPRYVLSRMYALGSDVQSSVEVLLSTYESAQSAVRKSRTGMRDPKAEAGAGPEGGRC